MSRGGLGVRCVSSYTEKVFRLAGLMLLALQDSQADFTIEKQIDRLRFGMGDSEVRRIFGPRANSNWSSSGEARMTYVDDHHVLNIDLQDEKVVGWKVRVNPAPLIKTHKLLKIGMTPGDVVRTLQQELSPPHSYKNLSQCYLFEGQEPKVRTLEVNFKDGRLISRRFGENFVMKASWPWNKGWRPINDPPFLNEN